jgi:hypothetical protein
MSDKDIQKTPSSKKDVDVEEVSSEKPLDTGKEPPRSPGSPAEPVDAPYPETDRVSDTNTTEKVKIDGKKTATKDNIPGSIGDEPGSSFPDLSRVEQLKQVSEQLVRTFTSLGPAGQKLLAIALTAGLVVGYGSSALVCSNQKKTIQDQVDDLTNSLQQVTAENDQLQGLNQELQDGLQELEDELDEIDTMLQGCQETSQDLQGQISVLGNQIEERDEELSILNQGLSGSGDFLGLYIVHAELDEEKNRMNLLVGNSLPVNSIIASISLWNTTHRYTDISENATGIIMGSMAAPVYKTFTWSPQQAQAPEGFFNADDSYVVTVISVTGYSDSHIYQAVKMSLDVIDWGFNDDSLVVAVYNDALRFPFPRAAVMGVRKTGTGVYYNVSMPAIVEEETLGGAHYAWNASASGAPEGFLRKDTKYFIRVTYIAPESWYNWDKDYSEFVVWSPEPKDKDDGNDGPLEPPGEF